MESFVETATGWRICQIPGYPVVEIPEDVKNMKITSKEPFYVNDSPILYTYYHSWLDHRGNRKFSRREYKS